MEIANEACDTKIVSFTHTSRRTRYTRNISLQFSDRSLPISSFLDKLDFCIFQSARVSNVDKTSPGAMLWCFHGHSLKYEKLKMFGKSSNKNFVE